jgi:hypothetical protein
MRSAMHTCHYILCACVRVCVCELGLANCHKETIEWKRTDRQTDGRTDGRTEPKHVRETGKAKHAYLPRLQQPSHNGPTTPEQHTSQFAYR